MHFLVLEELAASVTNLLVREARRRGSGANAVTTTTGQKE
jgi:hypothetical protein